MFEVSLPLVAAWVTAVFLAVAGLVNLFNSRKVRELYERWDIPAHSFRTVGLLEISAAIFLVAPDLRAWGIALAAPLIFRVGRHIAVSRSVLLRDTCHRHACGSWPGDACCSDIGKCHCAGGALAYRLIGATRQFLNRLLSLANWTRRI